MINNKYITVDWKNVIVHGNYMYLCKVYLTDIPYYEFAHISFDDTEKFKTWLTAKHISPAKQARILQNLNADDHFDLFTFNS